MKTDMIRRLTAEQLMRFQFSRYPEIQADAIGLSEAFSAATQNLDRARRILQILVLLGGSKAEFEGNVDSFKARLAAIGEDEIDVFADSKNFKVRLEGISRFLKLNTKALSLAVNASKNHIDALTGKQISIEKKIQGIGIEEVEPGIIAAFRGLVTSDCSTDESAGFGLLPLELNLFIFSPTGCLNILSILLLAF
jgi:hypothetical protein